MLPMYSLEALQSAGSSDRWQSIELASSVPDPFHVCLHREARMILNESVGRLPKRQREVTQMLLDGVPQGEMATRLGISRQAISKLLRKAYAGLRSRLVPRGICCESHFGATIT